MVDMMQSISAVTEPNCWSSAGSSLCTLDPLFWSRFQIQDPPLGISSDVLASCSGWTGNRPWTSWIASTAAAANSTGRIIIRLWAHSEIIVSDNSIAYLHCYSAVKVSETSKLSDHSNNNKRSSWQLFTDFYYWSAFSQ